METFCSRSEYKQECEDIYRALRPPVCVEIKGEHVDKIILNKDVMRQVPTS
jgi:hypothetical protein